MPLNKVSKNSNMYQFISHTWNPLAGKCLHNCKYCSTNKFYYPTLVKKYTGEIRLQESELKTNLGKDNFIFVCAQNDLFAREVPEVCIIKIIEHCSKFDNRYLFQTKNPSRINDNNLPEKSVVCTTIETNRYYESIMGDSPNPIQRSLGMYCIDLPKYVTCEPLLRFDLLEMVELIKTCNPVQVNIGFDSGGNNLPEPTKTKTLDLVCELEKFTRVKIKSNSNRILNR